MEGRLPIGVISIGSNDIHLLVASSDGIKTFDRHVNQSMLAELVGTVTGGVIPIAALNQALTDLETLVKAARTAGASPIIAIATEALREVANGPAFIEMVATTLHISATLVSGQEEAALDYCWATFPHTPPIPLLVVDSGGGSTQILQGEASRPAFATSLPVGAGNMTNRFLTQDPPTKEELEALREYIAAQVAALPIVLSPRSAVLMGGSADHLLSFAANPAQQTMTFDDLHHALHELHTKPAKQMAHEYQMLPERAHLLAAGAVILQSVLAHYGMQEAQVKADGIRGGLVLSYARQGESWRQSLPLPLAAT